MLIEGVGRLGAEVAVFQVEVESADAERAADAGELRASPDRLGGVVFNGFILVPWGRASGAVVGWQN